MLDRHHGLAAAGATNRQAIEPRCLSRPGAPLALTRAAPGLEPSTVEAQNVTPKQRSPGSRRERLTAKRSRPEMAPQRLEKIESAPGNGMGSEASNLQDLVRGRADRARLRPTSRENDKVAEKGA